MRKSVFVFLLLLILFIGISYSQEKIQIQPEKDWEKIIIVPNPETSLSLDLWLNKPEGSVYKVGENLIIYAKANDDVYLYIFDITPDGQFTLIFPNSYSKDNFIKKDRTYTFPDKPTYSFKVTPPYGKEYIVGVITKKPIEIFPGKKFESMAPGSVIEKSIEKALETLQKSLRKEEGKTWAQKVTYFYVQQEVQSKSKINIYSNPRGAQVYLNDQLQGNTPITLMLYPGNYRITLKKEGYEDYLTNIVVQEGRDRDYTFNLKPVYGNLRVDTEPKGASIYLDGSFKGYTPLTLYNLPANKTYQLKVTYPGYQEKVVDVNVLPNQTNYVFYSLVPLYGSLNINSYPQGADLYLNGVYKGKTPIVINNVSPGRYQVQLRLSGYKDYVSFVDVYAGQVSTYNFTLVPLPATLNIFSNPSSADVYINGVYKGKTPLSLTDLSSGTYNVKISLSGYEEYNETVYLAPGDLKQINVTLKPINLGEVYIDSNPKGAKVFIDGVYKGITPLNLTLIEGRYKLTLSLDGYVDLNTDILVKRGEKSNYLFTLTSIVTVNRYYINFTKGGYDGNLIVVKAENVFIDKEGKDYVLAIRPTGKFEVKVTPLSIFRDVILKINFMFDEKNKKKEEIDPSLVIYINGKAVSLPLSIEDKDFIVLKYNVKDLFNVNQENIISLQLSDNSEVNIKIKEIVVELR